MPETFTPPCSSKQIQLVKLPKKDLHLECPSPLTTRKPPQPSQLKFFLCFAAFSPNMSFYPLLLMNKHTIPAIEKLQSPLPEETPGPGEEGSGNSCLNINPH